MNLSDRILVCRQGRVVEEISPLEAPEEKIMFAAMSASESAMNSVSPRQQQILALARQSGNVTVDDLALRFDVTPQTIRKDLNELCDGRFLARTHGGAILSSGVENLAYEARLHMAAAEKIVIGKKAASLIPDNCSLFINIGTTTEEVARAL
eukprot:gene25704-25866_t